jgi:enoyl-CoA hydratase
MGYVSYSVSDDVGVMTLDRPRELNALSTEGIREVNDLLETIRKGRASGDAYVRCLVVTGAGKAFIAGANIRELRAMDHVSAREFSRLGNRLLHAIETFPVPVVAAVNGDALGGGLELALAADIIIASTAARFGMPEVTLGIMPGFGGIPRLADRVGEWCARDLVLTGRMIDAAEALRIGLVGAVVERDQVLPTAMSIAARIASVSPNAIAKAKAHFVLRAERGRRDALEMEPESFGSLFDHPDAREGLTAFVEKRKPRWGGA